MLFKFAFRNVLRNKRRSFLTALAIFFGALIVGLAQGWINGMIDLMMDNYIVYQTGNVRITSSDYIERERFMPVDALMPGGSAIKKKVQIIPGVAQIEERIRFGILLGHRELTEQALGIGLDLENTKIKIKDKLIEGVLGQDGLYIGAVLAKKLGISLGDDLLLATKTSEGGLNGIKVKVQGIFHMGITMYDRKMFFINLVDAKKLLKIYEGTTELYVYTNEEKLTDLVADSINGMLPEAMVAQTYKQQIGPMYSYMASMKIVYMFVEALILFLASFIVINTMMMAIFERLHEIGTLKAMGMTDKELFVNFTLEGGIIGAMGGIPGALAGYGIIAVMSVTGVNLESALSSMDMPIEYILHPKLSAFALIMAVVISIIVPALAAMLPARYAEKLQPAEALRK
ncbi:FtsX-like permease family protein [bacterium]|nr:FtsX-like permease family protein [bacterium]